MFRKVFNISRILTSNVSKTFERRRKPVVILQQPEILKYNGVFNFDEALEGPLHIAIVHGEEFGSLASQNEFRFLPKSHQILIQKIRKVQHHRKLLNKFRQSMPDLNIEAQHYLFELQQTLVKHIQETVTEETFLAQVTDMDNRIQSYWRMEADKRLTICPGSTMPKKTKRNIITSHELKIIKFWMTKFFFANLGGKS